MIESGTEITPFPEKCAHYNGNRGAARRPRKWIVYCIHNRYNPVMSRPEGLDRWPDRVSYRPAGDGSTDPDRPGIATPGRTSAMEDKR